MLRIQAEGRRKPNRTIKLETVDKDSPFIAKMKKHLKNYKFYGSETDEPEIMELTDQDEVIVDSSEDAPIAQVPRRLNNNEPDLRDTLNRKATKRLLEDRDVDARAIIEAKASKKPKTVEIYDARREDDEEEEVEVVPDSPVFPNPEVVWDSLEYVYLPENMKKRIVTQTVGRKEYLNQKFKAHSNHVYELTIDRERIRTFPAHSGTIQNYYKHLRGLRGFLSDYVAHIDELSANIFSGNLDDKEVADRRAYDNPRKINF